MIVTQYHLAKFGLDLAAAAVEVEELNSRFDHTFEDLEDPVYPAKDGYVKIKVWVNEQAYNNGLSPIYTEEKPVLLDHIKKKEFHDSVLQDFLTSL